MTLLGVDLGATKILGVRLAGGEVAGRAKQKTPVRGGPQAVVDAIAAVVAELGGPGPGPGGSLGVGAPGVVDSRAGVVQQAPNLAGWVEPFALGPALAERVGATVLVENDVNAGTVAEHRRGAGRGSSDLLGVFAGSGVGGGLVLDGRLRRGSSGLAGEIGHMIVQPGGRMCPCGGKGHLEAYAGRAAMERRARKLDAGGRDTALVSLAPAKRMTSSVWAKALAADDAVASELIDEAVHALGVAIASVVTVLDVPLVVVGGGLADRLGAPFVARVGTAVRAQVFAGGAGVKVVPSELGELAGAVGAALLAADEAGAPAVDALTTR